METSMLPIDGDRYGQYRLRDELILFPNQGWKLIGWSSSTVLLPSTSRETIGQKLVTKNQFLYGCVRQWRVGQEHEPAKEPD